MEDMKLEQINVKIAFVHGVLEEEEACVEKLIRYKQMGKETKYACQEKRLQPKVGTSTTLTNTQLGHEARKTFVTIMRIVADTKNGVLMKQIMFNANYMR